MGVHDGHRQKMRRRFLTGGLDSFAPHEALELLLYYAIPRRDTNVLAHALLERYGSLSAVFNAPVEDLMRLEGIGESAAILLHLVPQLSRRAGLEDAVQSAAISSSVQAGKYLLPLFEGKKREAVYQLCLDRKGKLLACKFLGEGGAACAVLDVRQVAENAILTAASAVILAHIHPSGVALPSPEDYAMTDRMKQALATVGVVLSDHIIVADGDFVSMADSGYLP